jgi:uncharacterized membrane protein
MKQNKGHKFHGILMPLCCLAPIVLITVLPSLNLQNSSVKNVVSVLLVLACPLGHIFMMKFMPHKHQDVVDEKG